MTNDIVFRVSLPGFDVKDATPEQCAIDGAYDTLKLKLDNGNPYFQRVSIDFVTNPPLGTINVFEFDHDLPNDPAWYFLFDTKDSFGPATTEYGPDFDLDALADHTFHAYRVGNKIKLDFITNNDLDYVANPFIGRFYEFRFYCYANDGE